MRHVEAPRAIRTWRIVCAGQSRPDYNEERLVLLYAGDEPSTWDGSEFMLLEGDHCSCYDWNDVQWDAVVYTLEELEKLSAAKEAERFAEDWERGFWAAARNALGFNGRRYD